MNEVKAIIFDMDGLMLDTERLFLRAYQEAAQATGFDIPRELYLRMVGHRADASQQILANGMPDEAPVDTIIKNAHNLYMDLILNNGVSVQPGLIELLAFLDEIRMPRGVATSTHYDLACTKLKSVNLLGRMEHVTAGDQVEHGKPAPDIFVRVAEKLGVACENCIVLEDSLTGLKGARAAGAMPVLIPDLAEPSAEMMEMAEVIFPSLVEFHECFKAARCAKDID